MKKLFPTLALCLLVTTSYAQTAIKAGTVQLGGNVGYSKQSTDSTYPYYTGSSYINTTQHIATNSFSINPMAGYFIADNLSVGISFSQGIYKTTYSYDTPYIGGNEQRNSQLNLGAFVQYYQMLTDHFGLTGTLNAGYNHGTTKTTSDNNGGSNSTSNGFSAGLIPSIVFFPVPKFSVGASIGGIGYSHATGKVDVDNNALYSGTNSSSTFGANFGLSYLAFSGTYYVGR